jgi:hypothetical protein
MTFVIDIPAFVKVKFGGTNIFTFFVTILSHSVSTESCGVTMSIFHRKQLVL